MKLIKSALLFGAVLFFVAGCSLAVTPVSNTVDLSQVDFTNAASFKESKACASYLFGFKLEGNPSVMEAVKSGGIKKVKSVDYQVMDFVVFRKACVVVYGQ